MLDEIAARAKALGDDLRAQHAGLVDHWPLDRAAAAARRTQGRQSYRHVDTDLRDIWSGIRGAEASGESVRNYNALLLTHLVATAPEAIGAMRLPETLVAEYAEAFGLAMDSIEAGVGQDFDSGADRFLKRLGICAQRLIPASSAVLEVSPALPVKPIVRKTLAEDLPALARLYLGRFHGRGPVLVNHLFRRDLFNPDGRKRGYWQVAQLMRARPALKALFGVAWYYDPAVTDISPHLAYVRDHPQSHGARFFPSHPDPDGGATYSRTRRARIEDGTYAPRKYMMVWPRAELLAWAETYAPERA